MENNEKLTAIKNELLVYISTTKSAFLTVETIEVFKNQINESDNEVELLKIKKSLEEQVEASEKFDIISDKQRRGKVCTNPRNIQH